MMGVSKKLLWVFLFLLPLCVHAQQDSLAVSSEPVEQVEEGEQQPQLKPKFGFLSYSTVIRLMPEYAQAQDSIEQNIKRLDEKDNSNALFDAIMNFAKSAYDFFH